MKQVEVTILGQSYLLGCPDDGEQELLAAVGMVDREMCTIRDAGKIKARERIAVLAALNLAYRLAEQKMRAPAEAAPQGSAAPEPAAELGSSDVQALIARLDSVLSEDGRLL